MTASVTPPHSRSCVRQPLYLSQEGGANQADASAANINNIVAQFQATGVQPTVNRHTPLYGDFSEAMDLHHAINTSRAAVAHFESLPSGVRAAADNDPVNFIAMVQDEEGSRILSEAGLVVDDQAEPPIPAPEGDSLPNKQSDPPAGEEPPTPAHASTT